MPIYQYECKKCKHVFEELCSWDESNKIKCQKCNSKKVNKLLPGSVTITFKNPKGTSKEDNFEYVAKTNYERAQMESAAAREQAKSGSPYRKIDDISRGMNYID